MGVLLLTSLPNDQLPVEWEFMNGSWQRKSLIRPQRNRSAVAAVESDRHVAFPGICMTRQGNLVAVYR